MEKHLMFVSAHVVEVGVFLLPLSIPMLPWDDALPPLQFAFQISPPILTKPISSQPYGKPPPGNNSFPSPNLPHLQHLMPDARKKSSVLEQRTTSSFSFRAGS